MPSRLSLETLPVHHTMQDERAEQGMTDSIAYFKSINNIERHDFSATASKLLLIEMQATVAATWCAALPNCVSTLHSLVLLLF